MEFTKAENEHLKALEESPSIDRSTGSEPEGSTGSNEQDSWLTNIQTFLFAVLLVDQAIIETISKEPQLQKTSPRCYKFFSCLLAVNATYVIPILFFVSGCIVSTSLDVKPFSERLRIRVQSKLALASAYFLLSIGARKIIGFSSEDVPDAPFYSTEVGRDISLFLPSLYTLLVLLLDSAYLTWSRFFRTSPSISSTFRYRCILFAAFLSLTTLQSIGYIYPPVIFRSFFPESVSEMFHSHFPLQYLLSFSVGTQFTTLAPYIVISHHPALTFGGSVVASIAGLIALFRHFPSQMPFVTSLIVSPSTTSATLSADWKLAFAFSSWNTFCFILISTALISVFNTSKLREPRAGNAFFLVVLQSFIPMWLVIGIVGKFAWISNVTLRLVFLIASSLLLTLTILGTSFAIFLVFLMIGRALKSSEETTKSDPQDDTANATKHSPEDDLDIFTPSDRIHWLDSLRNFLITLLVLERSILMVTSTTPRFDDDWSYPFLTLGLTINRNFIVGGLCFVSGFAAHISKEYRSASSFHFLLKRTWKRAALACAYFLSGQLVNFFHGPWNRDDGIQDTVTPFYALGIGKTALIDDPILYLALILSLDYLYIIYDTFAGFLSPGGRGKNTNRFMLFFVVALSIYTTYEGTRTSTEELMHPMGQDLPYPMIIDSLFRPHAPMQYLAAYLVGIVLSSFCPQTEKTMTTSTISRPWILFALAFSASLYFLSELYTSYPVHIARLIDMRVSPLRKSTQDPVDENLSSYYALWSTASFVFVLFSLVFGQIGVAPWGLGRWMAYVQGLVHLFFVFGFAKHMGWIESVVGRCAGVFLGSLGCGYVCAVVATKAWTALEASLRGIRGQPHGDVEKREEIELK